jgi:WD40 repeat protein
MTNNRHNISELPGFKLRHILQGNIRRISHLQWAPNGVLIAVLSEDKAVEVWNIISGKRIPTFRLPGGVTSIVWSPDAKLLAIGYENGAIRLWSTQQRQQVRVLKEHTRRITSMSWTQDRALLASHSEDHETCLWQIDAKNQDKTRLLHSFRFSRDQAPDSSIAWSPDGHILAGYDGTKVIFWDLYTKKFAGEVDNHTNIGLSTQAEHLEESSESLIQEDTEHAKLFNDIDLLVKFSDIPQIIGQRGYTELQNDNVSNKYEQNLSTLTEAFVQLSRVPKVSGFVSTTPSLPSSQELTSGIVCWSPDGRIVALGAGDTTIRLWNPETGRQTELLEGHTDRIINLSFSYNGDFLASNSLDGTLRIWNCNSWDTVVVLPDTEGRIVVGQGMAFSPKNSILATTSKNNSSIILWELDLELLKTITPVYTSLKYTNAKVVLIGDTGVGKSGLGLVLAGEPFSATDSTHGRRIWTFDTQTVVNETKRKETQETLLWDLAGQPGYRLIHQLHLNEVVIALVVFDARSEIDPFAGVHHWARALRQAQRVQGDSVLPMKKFLVAARMDRGGIGVSRERINTLISSYGFDKYFETSARESWAILELAEAIRQNIDWNSIPKVNSNDLFQSIKSFLIQEKEGGRILSTADDLFRSFNKLITASPSTTNLIAEFETCIGRVEARGLIRRLSFGNLVLLQPELLDAYASALVNIAKSEPDGLGSITEEDARSGNFPMSEDERIKDKEQERLLLIATIEDMLRYEIVLRENSEDGPLLVFPSQLTRENPDLPDPPGKSLNFLFEGSVLNIYATLAVRLSHSGFFTKRELWRNAATYNAKVGGICGMSLREIEEGLAELTLFFDSVASEEVRFQFEDYVQSHLARRALPETIRRKRIFICKTCDTPITELQVERRRERGFDWIACNVCENKVSLLDREARITGLRKNIIDQMDRAADTARIREVSYTVNDALEERQHLFSVITAKNRRLRTLELQRAQFGIDTPAHILTEIDELKQEIDSLNNQMQRDRGSLR